MTLNNLSWKEGDVYRWNYSDTTYESIRKHKSDPYWCCSGIGVVQECNGTLSLVDTYWSSDNKQFTMGDIATSFIEVVYLGNLHDYESTQKQYRSMYKDEDWLDLSHSNNSNQYYLRKGAVKCQEKMRKIALRNAFMKYREIINAKHAVVWELEKALSVELEYLFANNHVDMSDNSYLDEEVEEWLSDVDVMFDKCGIFRGSDLYEGVKALKLQINK